MKIPIERFLDMEETDLGTTAMTEDNPFDRVEVFILNIFIFPPI